MTYLVGATPIGITMWQILASVAILSRGFYTITLAEREPIAHQQ